MLFGENKKLYLLVYMNKELLEGYMTFENGEIRLVQNMGR